MIRPPLKPFRPKALYLSVYGVAGSGRAQARRLHLPRP